MSTLPRTLLVAALLVAAGAARMLAPASLLAAPGDHHWSRGFPATGLASIDDSGAVVSAGTFFGAVSFGGAAHFAVNAVRGDVFVARYAPSGAYLWSRSFTPSLDGLMVSAVAAEAGGGVYVAGRLVNTSIDFGGGALVGAGDLWIAKLDALGNHEWSLLFADGGEVADLASSPAGVAVTGEYAGAFDIGGTAFASAGGTDIFVGVLDPLGNHVWSASYGDGSSQRGKSIVLGDGGGVGLAGYISGTVDFGGGPIVTGGSDVCLARFNGSGVHDWSQSFTGGWGGAGAVRTDLALGPNNELALCGSLIGSVDFGGGALSANGGADATLAVFDSGGGHLSSRLVGGAGADSAQGVQFDAAGHVVLTGRYEGIVDFGDGPVASAGLGDLYVSSWSLGGLHLWKRTFGTPFEDSHAFASTDPLGGVVVHGSATLGIDFGGGALPAGQFFVAKLAAASTTVDAPTVTAGAAATATAFPNPFRASTVLRLQRSDASRPPAQVTVHDVHGRAIRTIALKGTGTAREATWDGRDDTGRLVPAGVYLWQAGVSGSKRDVGRIVRIR